MTETRPREPQPAMVARPATIRMSIARTERRLLDPLDEKSLADELQRLEVLRALLRYPRR